ncbi:chromosome segregation protein [compost metagenome]
MKLDALRLFNVKRFADTGVSIEGFGDGVNVLCVPNEAGKSTSFEALNALFFVKHSSTATDARALRPYSGGNCLVEAEVTTDQGRYRITKQFFGRSHTKVLDLGTNQILLQADEAENFISGLVQGGSGGPAGLLWVKQGVTGWDRRPKAEEDSEKSARASLLQSVQGEVEAITGGRRMAEILSVTAASRSELVTTTGRPKAGGKYAAAIDLRDRLQAELQRLEQDVQELRDALARRAAIQRRLAELDTPDERQARLDAVAKAEAAFETARVQHEALKTLEAELNLAVERRTSAQRGHDQYRDALAQLADLSGRMKVFKNRYSDTIERRFSATEAEKISRAEAVEAEQAVVGARAALDQGDAAQRARDAIARSQTLKDKLARAIGIRGEIEILTAKIAAAQIPTSAIRDMEELDVQIVRLTAMRDAARPSVTVDYEAGAPARLQLDGRDLIGSEERTYDGHATLSAPGIGTVHLRSNRSDDLGQLTALEESRRTLLASIGVGDLDAARSRQTHAQHLEGLVGIEKAKLAVLAPEGIDKLQEVLASHDDIDLSLLDLDLDRNALQAAYEEAVERRRSAMDGVGECEAVRFGADAAYIAGQTDLAKLEAQDSQITAVLGPADTREARLEALTDQLAILQSDQTTAQEKVDELRASATNFVIAEAALSRVRSVKDVAELEIRNLREENAGLNAQIRTRSDEAVEETRNEIADALAAAQSRVESFEHEIAILDRLYGALDAARSDAKELYLTPVMNELQPLLSLLFEDASISFNDQTLLPESIVRKGVEEEVVCLSGGMREQLSILTRLAFARLMARDGRPAPVIFDDALVYSDDDRIERMFNALHLQAREQQIIVFSCRQRAFQNLGGRALQMAEWTP